MPKIFNRLGAQIGLGVFALLFLLTAVLFAPLFNQSRTALIDAYTQRQAMSLEVLTDKMTSRQALQINRDPQGTITGATAQDILPFDTHEMIDSVGAISGETATIFVWDDVQNDYVRRSTNIIKPDGTRAVGTVLGQDNPVYAAMRRGEVFRGEATILGKQYLTIYVPIETSGGAPLGILYVGVAKADLSAAVSGMLWTALSISALALAVATLATAGALRYLLSPIARLGGAVNAIRNKQYETSVPYADRPDNIGELARNVDGFRLQLLDRERERAEARSMEEKRAALFDELVGCMHGLSEGKLTTRIDIGAWEDLGQGAQELCSNLNGLAQTFQSLTQEMQDSLSSVKGVATELKEMSGAISQRAENQAATLEESAAALEEISSSVRSSAERTNAASEMAVENKRHAESGTSVMERALAAMANISKSSGEITNIISVIDDIAFQTNLLALNAGVEAARAGESGKGFAVVASEVRALAQRATESAQEIRDLVLASASYVEEGEGLMQETHKSFEDIVEKSGQVTGLVSEIASSTQEQSTGILEINAGVSELDSVTQQNASMVVEINQTSDRLTQHADRAGAVIARFLKTPQAELGGWSSGATRPGLQTPQHAELGEGTAFASETHSPAFSEAPLPKTGTDDGAWSAF